MSETKMEMDVKGTVGFVLHQLREGLLVNAAIHSPTDLVDQAIAGTLSIAEKHFTLISKVVTTAEGTPLEISGLVQEYWDIISDQGE